MRRCWQTNHKPILNAGMIGKAQASDTARIFQKSASIPAPIQKSLTTVRFSITKEPILEDITMQSQKL